MRQVILFLCLAISDLNIYCQNIATDSSVTCNAYWKKGDKRSLTIIKTNETLNSGKREKFDINRYGVTIEILNSTKKVYDIEWKLSNLDTGQKRDTSTEAFVNGLLDFIDLKIIYKANKIGSFDTLVNYEEIKKIVEESISRYRSAAANKNDFDNKIKNILEMWMNRKMMEGNLLRDIKLLHSAFGFKYSFSKHQYPTRIANFFGGPPLPAILSEYLIKLDLKADTAKIAYDQDIDQERAAQIIKATLKEIEKNSGDSKNIAINDHTEYDFILTTGWIRRVYFQRIIKVGAIKNIQTCEITFK